MKARIVTLSGLGAAEGMGWADLADRSLEPNPFLEPTFVVKAHSHLTPDWTPVVALAGRGDRIDAALPLLELRSWRKLPWRTLVNRTSQEGQPHPIGLGTPLIDLHSGGEALGAIFDVLVDNARRRGPRLLALEWIGLGGPMEDTLQEVLRQRNLTWCIYESWDRPTVRRRPTPTYLEEGLGTRHRRELDRRRRRLGEAAGGALQLVDRSGDPSSLDTFLRLEASGWKGRANVATVATRAAELLFREVCQCFQAAGRLWMPALESAGEPVAMACYLRSGDGLFCRKIAYDEALARFSPGVHLDATVMQQFHHDPAAFLDSCNAPGDTRTATTWPDRRRLGTVLVALHGSALPGLVRGLPAGRRLSQRVRQRVRPDPRPST